MEIDKVPAWFLALEQEDAAFLKNFVVKSGSLKEIARLDGRRAVEPVVQHADDGGRRLLVRLRLDRLIQKIELSDHQEEEPFPAFIKGLAVDSRIDLETAKLIIEKYQKERKL